MRAGVSLTAPQPLGELGVAGGLWEGGTARAAGQVPSMTGEGKASETRSETRLPFYSALRVHFNIHKHPALLGLLPAEPVSPALGLPRNPSQTLGPSAGEGIIFPPSFFCKICFL